MAILEGIKKGIGVKIRKKIIAPSAYGIRGYGAHHYGAGAKTHGIYRVRHRWGKVIQEKMDFYWPTNRQTEAQQAWRQVYADSIVAWRALTDEQKTIYNKKAIGKRMSGYNLFQQEYLLSH